VGHTDDHGASVQVGSRVRIRNAKGGPEQEVEIVASRRDMGLYRLPPSTPLGRALLGRRQGEDVMVDTEAGSVTYSIVALLNDQVDALELEVAERTARYPEYPAILAGADEPRVSATAHPASAGTAGEGTVRVGSRVRVRDGELDEWWRIVSHHEADAQRRWLSEEAPLARALLGHVVGERVRVDRPGDRSPVTILGVE
jgi:transcription elongation GreA/GreB family factor